MPIATVSRSRSRKHNKGRKVKPTAVVKGYQLNRVERRVKKLMPRLEWKSIDTTQVPTTITTTAAVTNVAAIAQGTGESQRVGDKVTLRSWVWRMAVTPNATAGTNFLRMILIRDKQGNGSAPAIADILQSATNFNSPLNNDSGQRLKVLFDRTYTVDTDATGAQTDKMYRKFKILAEYSAAGTIPITNSLYLVQISDQAVNGPSVEWYSRVRFTDG